jgi:cell fate (sporulation/competence/biofilm development) regulator YlbF (YheA/YmcA/DUF963 family)
MVNIYDNANDMATALKSTQQYQELKQAFDMLKLDAVAYGLFQQFQTKQVALQQKQATGQELPPEDLQDLQNVGEKMQKISSIQDLIQKEQAMAGLMDELNAIVSQPIADLYRPENA